MDVILPCLGRRGREVERCRSQHESAYRVRTAVGQIQGCDVKEEDLSVFGEKARLIRESIEDLTTECKEELAREMPANLVERMDYPAHGFEPGGGPPPRPKLCGYGMRGAVAASMRSIVSCGSVSSSAARFSAS